MTSASQKSVELSAGTKCRLAAPTNSILRGVEMHRHTRHLLAAAVVVAAGMTTAAVVLSAQGASKIQRGADVAPVPLNMNGLNPALVREGSYIVNAHGGCNDCHTVP